MSTKIHKVYPKNFLLKLREENTDCPIQLQEERWKLIKSSSSSSYEGKSFEEVDKSDIIENEQTTQIYNDIKTRKSRSY